MKMNDYTISLEIGKDESDLELLVTITHPDHEHVYENKQLLTTEQRDSILKNMFTDFLPKGWVFGEFDKTEGVNIIEWEADCKPNKPRKDDVTIILCGNCEATDTRADNGEQDDDAMDEHITDVTQRLNDAGYFSVEINDCFRDWQGGKYYNMSRQLENGSFYIGSNYGWAVMRDSVDAEMFAEIKKIIED